jgi:glycosyltransferase involved in cell wall biosynthesis
MRCREREIESACQIIFNQPVKVSVLIPTYNSEEHLVECLDSVLAQDFADLEIIISDDRSTDGTMKIVEAYAARDSRIRCWQNPKNLGPIANHNLCLQEARGEYVKYIHGDDKLLSTADIRKLAAALDANPSAVLAGSQQHVTGTKARPRILLKKSGVYDGRRLIIACFEHNTNFIGQPILTMFRRSAAGRGFDHRFIGNQDYEMWCYLLEQGDFVYLAEVLATWRVHQTQQTAQNQKSKSREDEHLAFLEIYYSKPWVKEAATHRMLFTQIYHLNKKYGARARPLISAMMAQLSRRHYAWEWLKYKVSRPFEKLQQKVAG